ncbi:MAG: F0F1 ATP synthase subunit B [Candidatus Paceibacterota bacterium]|jgi:F-type H+-transporting ATPase subunit b|nr:F0F1 ATP synthase subunit B [bacterium]
MEGLEIDWKVLLGQIINFAILFGLLSYFVYKPFLSLLKNRRDKIAEGINKTHEAEERMKEIENIKNASDIKNDADRKILILKAEEDAKTRAIDIVHNAEEEKAVILVKAQKESENLKEKEKERTKQEIVNNAFNLAEKILKENIDKNKSEKITAEFLSKLKI